MSSQADVGTGGRRGPGLRAWAVPVGAVFLIAVMALDTHVVRIGSEADVQPDVFSAEAYGEETFPEIRVAVEEKAAPAETLAAAIAEDREAAVAQHGTPSGIAPVMSVSFTGTVGEGKSGVYEVDVEGLTEDVLVRVQTGPAVTGTALRDAPGTIEFGQFTNQIEYQNAGAAINEAMKERVLADLDRDALSGRTISVTGAFSLINPANWLVTPVRLEVR